MQNNAYDKLQKEGAHNVIKFSDGTEAHSDYTELLEKVDIILSMYGLGGHTSLADYVEMINQEDPVIVDGLIDAATKRIKAMYGDPDEPQSKMAKAVNETVKIKPRKYSNHEKKYDTSKGGVQSIAAMKMFLREWGATKQEIAEAEAKIKSGQIQISNEDFSWINPETLNSPEFDMDYALKRLKEEREKSINIKVSLSRRLDREKNG